MQNVLSSVKQIHLSHKSMCNCGNQLGLYVRVSQLTFMPIGQRLYWRLIIKEAIVEKYLALQISDSTGNILSQAQPSYFCHNFSANGSRDYCPAFVLTLFLF